MSRFLRRRALLAASMVFALPALPTTAFAQGYPDHSVKLTVGFPPGSGPDVVARLIGQKLGETLKQTVVIDNRAGAGGQIATNGVAKGTPDGYNILLAEVGSIAIAPPAFSKLPYDPAKELQVVTEVVRADFLLVVPTTSKYKTIAEFMAGGKAAKQSVYFATFGAGTPGHFGAEILAEAGGFDAEPIHYRSTGDAVTSIINGDVAGAFVSVALGSAQIKGGKMRALATTAKQRLPTVPDVPTFAESGLPKVDFSAWFAFFVPAGTPDAVVDKLNKALVESTQSPEVKQKLVAAGFSVTGTSQAEAEKLVKSEAPRWEKIVKQTGFKGD